LTAVDNITSLRQRREAFVRRHAEAENWSGRRPRRLSVVVGVTGLVAMAMLTLLIGRSTPDTRSSTIVIAETTTAPTTLKTPSATPTMKANTNWFDSHKSA
jgi:hypothetical protein